MSNRLEMSKFKMLDREHELEELKLQPEEKLAAIREQFLSEGLACEIIR